MSKVHVKTGDTVIVISGKDKGKKGQVLAVSPKEGKVIVEKANMIPLSSASPSCIAASPIRKNVMARIEISPSVRAEIE